MILELTAAGVRTSVDTTRAEVAEAALAAGATLVNDVSGGLADDGMAKLVADAGVPASESRAVRPTASVIPQRARIVPPFA